MSISVGQVVYASRNIWEAADGDQPMQRLANRGDKLIVRRRDSNFWWAFVSHEHRTDNSFGVDANEVTTDEPKSKSKV